LIDLIDDVYKKYCFLKFTIMALPQGSGFPLQVLARASLWAFHCNP